MKVSIVVIMYQTSRKVLSSTLASIEKQTYKDFECLLVDDGSDNPQTRETCNDFVEKDNRFRYLYKEHEGMLKARLYGVEKAQSDLLIFSDSDDLLERNMLEALMKAYLSSGADIVVADYYRCPFRFTKFLRKRLFPGMVEDVVLSHEEFVKKRYQNFFGIHTFPIGVVGKIYKRDLFKDQLYKSEINMIEDSILNIQLFERAEKIHFIPHAVYNYIYGGITASISSFENIRNYDVLYSFRKKYMERYGLRYRPVYFECKNIIMQDLKNAFEYGYTFDQLVEMIEDIKVKSIYIDLVNTLEPWDRGKYISLIEAGHYREVFNECRKSFTWQRRVKKMMRNWLGRVH